MLPSPSGCWLDPRGYSFSRPQCVHCYYSPVTRNLPWEDLVDRLRRFCFHVRRDKASYGQHAVILLSKVFIQFSNITSVRQPFVFACPRLSAPVFWSNR